MRTTLKSILVLVCLCLPTYAQTPEACRAAVEHLTLPTTAELAIMHPGLPLSPVEFLYSSKGIDFYSAIFTPTNYFPPAGSSHEISLILVYQDEAVRQQMIGSLRAAALAIRTSDGTEPSLDNFKFAVINCVDDGKEFLSTGKCVARTYCITQLS
jgi:hypothetical protein